MISNIGLPEVARAFAQKLSTKAYRSVAADYFARFPDLAADALGSVEKGRAARFAKELLERASRADAQSEIEEANEADLPEVLRNPPWLAKKKRPRRKAKVVKNPGTLDGPEGFAWTE